MNSKSFIDRRVTICMVLVAMTLLGYQRREIIDLLQEEKEEES